MNEQISGSKTFDLSQSSFVIFMSSYAPGLITGTIIILMIHSFLPDTIECLAFVILFFAMLIKAIMSLQLNKRTLVISDSDIRIFIKKRKNNILLTKINNDEIDFIKQVDDEGFLVTKTDGKQEVIPLSCYLKPYKSLLYSVKRELFEKCGANKTDFEKDKYLMEYIRTNSLPKALLKEDNSSKSSRVAFVIIYMAFAGIPTFLAVLALMILFLMALVVFLKGIIALLTVVQ